MKLHLHKNAALISAIIGYEILGLILLGYTRYYIDADLLSYTSVAQKYLAANFTDAINGFWGPMISWLLVPLLFFDIDPLLAVRMLSLVIGGLTIFGIYRLSYRFEMIATIRNLVLLISVPVILSFSIKFSGADLLLIGILIYYFNIIFRPDYSRLVRNAVYCGCLGAIAYLTKGFAFAFFVIHFILFNLLHYFAVETRTDRKRVLRHALVGLGIFGLLSMPWIYLISAKYQRIVISPTGAYNFAVMANPHSLDHPMAFQGLLDPPNASGLSIWEDPTYLKVEAWSPLQSWQAMKSELRLVYGNGLQILQVLNQFSLLATTILVAYLLFFFAPLRGLLRERLHYPLVTLLLYLAGYSLIQVQARYLWVGAVLLLVMGGVLMQRLLQSEFFSGSKRTLALALFCVSFIITPINELLRIDNNADYSRYLAGTARRLQTEYGIGGKIASYVAQDTHWRNTPLQTYWQYWQSTLFLTYYLSGQYYGTPKQNLSENSILAELQGHDIDYYFVWGDVPVPFLARFPEKTQGEITDLRVYALKERLSEQTNGS